MQALHDRAPGEAAGLLLMLPPAKARAQDMLDQGFVAAVRAHALPVDVAIIDAQADDYLEGAIGERLAETLSALQPARTWLMGISLGAYGCLELARRTRVEAALLLAPFLGSRDPQPGQLEEQARLCPLHLGFGEDDRYAQPSRRLARLLPAERVVVLPGGHDWATWLRLWRELLCRTQFVAAA